MQKKAWTLKGYTVKERIFQKNMQKKSCKKSRWGVDILKSILGLHHPTNTTKCSKFNTKRNSILVQISPLLTFICMQSFHAYAIELIRFLLFSLNKNFFLHLSLKYYFMLFFACLFLKFEKFFFRFFFAFLSFFIWIFRFKMQKNAQGI